MRERLTGAFVVVTVALLLGVLLAPLLHDRRRLRARERATPSASAPRSSAPWSSCTSTPAAPVDRGRPGRARRARPAHRVRAGRRPGRSPSRATTFDEGNDGQDFVAVVDVPRHDATLTLLQSDEVRRRPGRRRARLDRPPPAARRASSRRWSATCMSRLLAGAVPQARRRRRAARPRAASTSTCRAPGSPRRGPSPRRCRTSAGQLQERLAGEEAFAQHASHVLRTPLTGLRLDLEDLSMRDGPARGRARDRRARRRSGSTRWTRSPASSSRCRAATALVAGAEIPLRDLATECAQAWADALGPYDRALTAGDRGRPRHDVHPGPDRVHPRHPARRRHPARPRRRPAWRSTPTTRATCRSRVTSAGEAAHRARRRPGGHQGARRGHRARRPARGQPPRRRADDPAAAALSWAAQATLSVVCEVADPAELELLHRALAALHQSARSPRWSGRRGSGR